MAFFETIIVKDGFIRFWPQHWERILEAASVLRLSLPEEFTEEKLAQSIQRLVRKNACGPLGRVKLKVWRAGEGLYTPRQNEVEWLITAQPAVTPNDEPLHVGVCQSIRTIPSPFSSFKGINAPVYVMASKERAETGFDDLILLDPQGFLAEMTASNLFYLQDETLYTPSLDTGCVNGIARRTILQAAKNKNVQVREGKYLPDRLFQAEIVFNGNVTGVNVLSHLFGRDLSPTKHSFFQELKTLFQ